jgi:hypothetical protein
MSHTKTRFSPFVIALVGKDIVFRFIIAYSSLMDFGPWVNVKILKDYFFKLKIVKENLNSSTIFYFSENEK